MKLLDRNQQILDRMRHLQPIAEPIRAVLAEGKREQLDQGVTSSGAPFAPLAQSTLRHRDSGAPPLGGSSGRIGTGYTVTVSVTDGAVTATAGWPGLDWVRYHVRGTRKMPRRDPSGFRAADSGRCLEILREHCFGR